MPELDTRSLADIARQHELEDELDEMRVNDLPTSNLVSEIGVESGAE